jgi:hypothetical protein
VSCRQAARAVRVSTNHVPATHTPPAHSPARVSAGHFPAARARAARVAALRASAAGREVPVSRAAPVQVRWPRRCRQPIRPARHATHPFGPALPGPHAAQPRQPAKPRQAAQPFRPAKPRQAAHPFRLSASTQSHPYLRGGAARALDGMCDCLVGCAEQISGRRRAGSATWPPAPRPFARPARADPPAGITAAIALAPRTRGE